MGIFWNARKADVDDSLAVQMDGVVLSIDEETGLPVDATAVDADTFTGTNDTDLLPSMNQGLLQLRTGVYVEGRELRGRIFLPGWGENKSTAGRPSVSTLNDWVASANAELLGALDATIVVYSLTHKVFAPVIAITAWNEFAVLRSRRS
jgi:hypothetical protein